MARKVFFSFHYDNVKDFRVNVIRNSNVFKKFETQFVDGSLWEEAKAKSNKALKDLIDNVGLHNTSVTVLLIGKETNKRPWVRYEIVKSFVRGNGILGIYLNRIRNAKTKKIEAKGENPLKKLAFEIDPNGEVIYFYELKNKKWIPFKPIKSINNRKQNSLFFENKKFLFWNIGNEYWGKKHLFSDFFDTYCWKKDNGYENLDEWIEQAAIQSGR